MLMGLELHAETAAETGNAVRYAAAPFIILSVHVDRASALVENQGVWVFASGAIFSCRAGVTAIHFALAVDAGFQVLRECEAAVAACADIRIFT